MYCPTCGRFFPGEGSKCELCGAAIPEDTSQPKVPPAAASMLSLGARLECRYCRAPLGSGQELCPACGKSQSAVAIEYAGYWLRSAAFLLDAVVIVGILFGVLVFLVIIDLAIERTKQGSPAALRINEFMSSETNAGIAMLVALVFLPWLYCAVMECSASQATLGKKMLRLRVTDGMGRRIGFGRSTGRHFGKFISGLLAGGGFLMVAFSERKQALHDLLADCLVIRKH